MQKKLNMNYNERAQNNPLKILTLMDARLENLREQTDFKTGKASFKSVIHNKKKQFFEDYQQKL